MTGDCIVSASPESFNYVKNTSKISLITLNYELERKLKSFLDLRMAHKCSFTRRILGLTSH